MRIFMWWNRDYGRARERERLKDRKRDVEVNQESNIRKKSTVFGEVFSFQVAFGWLIR